MVETNTDLYDYDCEQGCSKLRSLRKKIEAVRKAAGSYTPPEGGFNIFGEILEILEAEG